MTATLEKKIWSKSQAALFRECQRKYHFSTHPSSDEVQSLKKLKNRYLWTGSLVHETVGDLLKTVRQGEALPSEDTVIESLKQKMRDEFKQSKKDEGPRLFEHYYGIQLRPELWQDQWLKVESALRWFLRSSWLSRMKELSPESWKVVDEVLSFDVDGIQAYVKIDCALQTGDRFVLIDWKTGAPTAQDRASLQVAALYAHEVWDAAPEQMDLYTVSLLKGQHQAMSVDEDALMETFLRIQEDTQQIESLHTPPEADPLALPFPSQRESCPGCNFQRLCYPNGISNS